MSEVKLEAEETLGFEVVVNLEDALLPRALLRVDRKDEGFRRERVSEEIVVVSELFQLKLCFILSSCLLHLLHLLQVLFVGLFFIGARSLFLTGEHLAGF